MKTRQVEAIALFSLLVFSAIAVAGDFTVLPGHSIGRIWIDAPQAKVRKIMGRPYLIQRKGNLTAEFWRVQGTGSDYLCAVYRRDRVVQIETSSPRFSTPYGVSVRSTLGYIRKIFGRMRVVSFTGNSSDPEVAEHATHYYDSIQRGIAFELESGSDPSLSADAVPNTLFIHRRGHQFLRFVSKEVWPN